MTERLLAALTDNGKWLEGFTRLGYESTFREYCNRFTPDYLAAVREAGESGLPALADSLLDALGGPVEAGPLLEPHNGPGRNQAGGSRVSDAYAHGGSGTAALCGRSAGPLEPALAQGHLPRCRVRANL